MLPIKDIRIRKVLDSRGNPTVEIDVCTDNSIGTASAPAGASRGSYEVISYPQGDVEAAIQLFRNKYIPFLIGSDAIKQREVDKLLHELDGTPNFGNMGGNIAVAFSLATAKAAANSLQLPLYRYLGGTFSTNLPYLFGNVLGGGKHAIGGTDIQEYLAVGLGQSFTTNAMAIARVHHKVKLKLQKRFPGEPLGKGDEGAWVAKISNIEALAIVKEACDEVRNEMKTEVRPALDIAASQLYRGGKYRYRDQSLKFGEQRDFVIKLIDEFGLYAVEDPLHENDFEGFAELTMQVGNKCLILGDDLFATNRDRIEKGARGGAANAVIIKPNQSGTLTDTQNAVKTAHEHHYKTVFSHRSGETTDVAIAHLAVAFGAHGIKTGIVGGERIAKINELIRIEEELFVR